MLQLQRLNRNKLEGKYPSYRVPSYLKFSSYHASTVPRYNMRDIASLNTILEATGTKNLKFKVPREFNAEIKNNPFNSSFGKLFTLSCLTSHGNCAKDSQMQQSSHTLNDPIHNWRLHIPEDFPFPLEDTDIG